MTPNRKVGVGAIAGALITIIVWLVKEFGGREIPAEIAVAGQTIIVFILQYLVPNSPEDESADREGGFVRLHLLPILASLALAPLIMQSCATTPADVLAVACDRSSAYSVERCAKGIGETWEVYQTRAEELVVDSATPPDVKRAIQTAEAASRPVVVEVLRSAAVVAQIRADLAAGATSDEKLAIANARLEEHIALALPRVRGLKEALGL